MFPITASCSAPIKKLSEADKIKALAFIKQYAERYKGRDVIIAGEHLFFNVNFFGMNGDKFRGISKGEFILSDTALVFTWHMYGIVLACFAAAVYSLSTHRYAWGVVAVILLVGGNWLYARLNFSRMTKELAQRINAL